MASESRNKMEKISVPAILLFLSLPGLLSASCSSPPFQQQQQEAESLLQNFIPEVQQEALDHLNPDSEKDDQCKNGWCGEDGNCICNPCWTGSTCQEYVDSFAPRFLAEEPFFILDELSSGGYSTFSDPAMEPIYPQFSDTFHPHQTPMPLFRLESSDDDLGLTCQLGQIGPATTCPCATPRYKILSASKTLQRTKKEAKKEAKNTTKGLKSPFWADEETGDVFLHQGFKLEPRQHYFITLQVSALPVNNTGFKDWKDEVVATLYVRPPSQKDLNDDTKENNEEDKDNSIKKKSGNDGNNNDNGNGVPYPLKNSFWNDENDDKELITERWKREVKEEEFDLFLTQVSSSSPSKEAEGFEVGDKIKMQLVIKIPLLLEKVDFDVEIFGKGDADKDGNDNDNPGKFGITSAHVSSISSGISFNKSLTNLAPIFKKESARSDTEIDTALWHWRGLENEKNEKNKGITIDFDIVPVLGSNSNSSSRPSEKRKGDDSPYPYLLLPFRARLTFLSSSKGSQKEKVLFIKIKQLIMTTDTEKQGRKDSKDTKDLNGTSLRVWVEGPSEIAAGSFASYKIKVFLQAWTQFTFTLTLEPLEGNSIQDQDSISVGDIRLVKVGEAITSCTSLPEKGFRVSCKKLKGGQNRGDLCSLQSPPLNICPLGKGEEESQTLEFEGIIYGLPSASAGSQFLLRAHVQGHHPAHDLHDEMKLSGKISKRMEKKKNEGHSSSNAISIMPSRKKRSLFSGRRKSRTTVRRGKRFRGNWQGHNFQGDSNDNTLFFYQGGRGRTLKGP